jgi:hypothetical protein
MLLLHGKYSTEAPIYRTSVELYQVDVVATRQAVLLHDEKQVLKLAVSVAHEAELGALGESVIVQRQVEHGRRDGGTEHVSGGEQQFRGVLLVKQDARVAAEVGDELDSLRTSHGHGDMRATV